MPGRWKSIAAGLLVALLLSIALAACGGGSSGSTASQAATAETAGKSPAAGSSGSGGGSAHFAPKQHHDSGGGSAQFRVKGGDNSVQEFGSEAHSAELAAAATALHNFLDARAGGDWAAACSYLATSVVESLGLAAQAKHGQGTSCAGILRNLTNPAAAQELKEEAAQADVGSLRTEGERAFIIYRGLQGTVLAMPMANENNHWKVASLGGTPLS